VTAYYRCSAHSPVLTVQGRPRESFLLIGSLLTGVAMVRRPNRTGCHCLSFTIAANNASIQRETAALSLDRRASAALSVVCCVLYASCCMLRAALRYALHRLLLCQVSVCVLPPSLLVVSGVLTGAAEGPSTILLYTLHSIRSSRWWYSVGEPHRLGQSSVLYRTTTAVLAVWCSVASQCLHGLYTAAEGPVQSRAPVTPSPHKSCTDCCAQC
jgi:hypothetical protein